MKTMKQRITLAFTLLISTVSFGQIQSVPGNINGKIYKMSFSRPQHQKLNKRSASNPTYCGQDTVAFTDLASTGYGQISVGNGQATGQFFGVNQEITVSGFRFYAYTPWDTNAKVTSRDVWCKIYEANKDSLPTGAAIDSVKVTLDTITGVLTFARLTKDAVFNKPIKISKPYVLTLECSNTNIIPLTLCNSYANRDGEGRNLSTVKVGGRWLRSLSLNIGGVTFDAHFQFLPFVSYNFGTDFSLTNCYPLPQQFTFDNNTENNVSGTEFYNSYMYYASAGFDDLCHTWTYENSIIDKEITDGSHQPSTKKNFAVKLTSYTVPYSLSLAFCYDSTEKTMYYKPGNPQLSSTSNGCLGDSLNLVVTTSVFNTKWFNNVTDTVPFNTGLSYTINNVSKADTFYLRNENGICNSQNYKVVTTANEKPKTLTVTNDSVCNNASANLKASTDKGNVMWYRSAVGGTAVFTGNVYSTNILTADTTFYAEANNQGCLLTSGRKAVKAFVNADFAPSKPTGAKDTSVCLESSNVQLQLTAYSSTSADVRWFNVATGGTPLTTGTSLNVNVSSRGEQNFYVETWDGRCGSGRIPVKVVSSEVPTTFAKVGDEICENDSADIAAAASWGGVQWFYTKSDVNPFSTNKFVRIGGLKEEKSYVYFKTYENQCINEDFDSIEVIVNKTPTANILSDLEVCKGGQLLLELDLSSGEIDWFDSESSTSPVSKGMTYNLGEVFSNTTMWYETILNGCRSDRKSITVKSLDKPVAGFEWELLFPKKVVCTPFNTNNMDILWEFGDGNISTDNIGENVYENEGTYTVKMLATSTISGCQDSMTAKVIVQHNDVNHLNPTMIAYPNPLKIGQWLQIEGLDHIKSITWTDLSGRIIGHIVNNNNNKFQSPEVEGLYIIKVNTDSGQQILKIQVQN
ncbi:MAG: PKD domain-containing protein [Bacteroidota bacterium]|nr:PKD domain-containing protein [Bacteroidota bacterium]